MTDFVELPDVLSREDLKRIWAMDAEQAPQAAMELMRGYEALLTRMRLAELAVYRSSCLADDMKAIIERGKTQRAGGPTPEGLANMAAKYVEHYVDPILPVLREALGFETVDGWYLDPEDARAKLVGNKRAKERLANERAEGMAGR